MSSVYGSTALGIDSLTVQPSDGATALRSDSLTVQPKNNETAEPQRDSITTAEPQNHITAEPQTNPITFQPYNLITAEPQTNLITTEPQTNADGVAGDPVPYSVRGDDVVTGVLICTFMASMAVLAGTRGHLLRVARHFFRRPSEKTTELTETTAETRAQLFFVAQTWLLFSVFAFLYTIELEADTFMLPSPNWLVAIFFGISVACFAVKMLAYWAVNSVFFGGRKSVQWLKAVVFTTAVEGFALFPAVLLLAYFDMGAQNAAFYVVFVALLVRLALLYKAFVMFFKKKNLFLQIILYFCALEIMPLLSLWGVLVKVIDYLKIIF